MPRNTLTLLLLLVVSNSSFSQTIKSNPIIYLEGFVGAAFGKTKGLFGGGEINYQFKTNLLTLRTTGTIQLGKNAPVGFMVFPVVVEKSSSSEYVFLYGYRKINGGKSYSFSLGISTNTYYQNITDPNGQDYRLETSYIGLPYELNIKWFNKNKEPLHKLYRHWKASSAKAFAASYGIKISGNLSENSFFSVSAVLGFGWHKHYQ